MARPRKPVDTNEVIRLHDSEGLGWRTIARRLALKVTTVRRAYQVASGGFGPMPKPGQGHPGIQTGLLNGPGPASPKLADPLERKPARAWFRLDRRHGAACEHREKGGAHTDQAISTDHLSKTRRWRAAAPLSKP
jgi:hypothetical protein